MTYISTIPYIETDALPSLCADERCLASVIKGSRYCIDHHRSVKNRTIDQRALHGEPLFYNYKNPDIWIYFIRHGEDGPIKIGYSANVNNRINTMQTDTPVRLILLGKIKDKKSLEQDLHKFFDNFKVSGEWFEPCKSLMDMIDMANNDDLDGIYNLIS